MRWIWGSCGGSFGKIVMEEETSCLERNGVGNLVEEKNEQLGKIRRAVLQTLTESSLPFIRSCEATLLLSV